MDWPKKKRANKYKNCVYDNCVFTAPYGQIERNKRP